MKFQTAYAQQVENKAWVIIEKDAKSELGKLPKTLTSQEAMDVLNLIRRAEHAGMLAGVEDGLRRGKNAADLRVGVLKTQMEELAAENTRLAELLEQHINLTGAKHGDATAY